MTDGEFDYVRALAQDYLEHVLQASPPGAQPGRVAELLREVALPVQEEVETSLRLCLDTLDVQSVDAARALFRAVMQKEFEDGVVNWGRIVTVFAFEGILVKKLLAAQADVVADADAHQEIARFVAEFITTHTGEWIRQNGGWENGFVKKFETECHRLTFLGVIGKVCKMFSLLKQYY
ncbi:bcl-2-related protein A1 [Artibeus jamaicensis]|uniref:bcl-2-related protein A1 n=1 Tax=Artibeus jamaicensis TaxID=9417 RepID=UPI00235B2DD7|nr:bcl-2-related protein A1 [Artibeus jamaicensis]